MRKKDTTTTTWTRAGKGGGRLWESLGWDGMGLHRTDKGSRGKHHHHDSACIGIFGGYTPQRIFSLCVCVQGGIWDRQARAGRASSPTGRVAARLGSRSCSLVQDWMDGGSSSTLMLPLAAWMG